MSCRRKIYRLLLGVCLPLALPAADAPVSLESPAPLELCDSCPAPQLRYLVVPKNGAVINASEAPVVELVSLGPLVREAYRRGLQATWVIDASKMPRAIDVAVDPRLLDIAGLYDVYLNLQPASKPDAPRLHVQFTKPAPKATPVVKLLIERTCYLPFTACQDVLPQLTIQEASHRSPLSDLQFVKVSNTVAGAAAVSGELTFGHSITVPAGSSRTVPYSLGGNFGLGLNTGSVTVNARELEAPALTVDFEVRNHYTRLYLVLTIILGLIFSYITKILLQQKIELEQARVDALKLAGQIEGDEPRHQDPEFRAAYAEALHDLHVAIDGTDAAAINAAKKSLDDVYRDALQKLATRRQLEQTALDGLLDITQNRWVLPPAVAAVVAKGRACAAGIQEFLRVDDLRQAKARRLDCQGALATRLLATALDWSDETGQTLDVLTGATEGISTTVAPRLALAAQQVRTLLAKIAPGVQLDSPDQIQQLLRDLQTARAAQSQFADWLCSAISLEVAAAQTQAPTNIPPALFDPLDRQMESWCTIVSAGVDEPRPAHILVALHGLQLAWKALIQGIATSDVIAKAIDDRRFLDALKLAAAQMSTSAGALRALVDRPAIPDSAGQMLPMWSLAPGPGATFLSIRTAPPGDRLPPPARPTLLSTTRQLMKDKLWLTLGVGVVLTVVGYGLYQDAWVGTFADFSAAFFWAFGLDLTIDQVMKATKKS
ncbi:MAG TPA: hypothetical protein VHW09_10945 [Bryobacteraceae bacterium]|jgi:hypothetical protein|nr:hypothetical protein [Bryobacteraceae bacterium]